MKQLFLDWQKWSVAKFKKADQFSSLIKAKKEIEELENSLEEGNREDIIHEYADVIMCLLHSAGKTGITVDEIEQGFKDKFLKNTLRKWRLNSDNTYSHI